MPDSPRRLDEIDTPAAVIDIDLVRRNLETMESLLRDTPVHIRPHVKTHKTPQLAHMQIAAGAPGVTAAKVAARRAMVPGGVTDILIANQIVGATKIDRLGRLAESATLTVAVDDAANVADLSAMAQRRGVSIGVVVDIEIGMKRCGVAPGRPVVDLARRVVESPGLDLVGLMGYEGHTASIADPAAREAAVRRSLALVIESKDLCEAAGIEIREVTGGATNTVEFTRQVDGWTEVQCGTYATMDAWYRPMAGHLFENAFWILSTVVSRPTSDRLVLDCGRKSVPEEPAGRPIIDEPEELELIGLSEEHGKVDVHGASDARPGDTVRVTPWHGCTTFNVHDSVYVLQGDEVVDVWAVTGRGKFT